MAGEKMLKVGQTNEIESALIAEVWGNTNLTLIREGVPADNSCFFHSVLKLSNPEYLKAVEDGKVIPFVQGFRDYCEFKFDFDELNNLGGGNFLVVESVNPEHKNNIIALLESYLLLLHTKPDLIREIVLKYSGLNTRNLGESYQQTRELLRHYQINFSEDVIRFIFHLFSMDMLNLVSNTIKKYSAWVGGDFIPFISRIIGMNIFVWSIDPLFKEPRPLSLGRCDVYYDLNRPSIMLYKVKNHYEPIHIHNLEKEEDPVQYVFRPDNDLERRLVKEIYSYLCDPERIVELEALRIAIRQDQ